MTAVSVAEAVERAAERLLYAMHNHVTVAPVRDLLGTTDIGAAYAIQQRLTRSWEQAGGVIVGRKIVLTSAAVQRQLNVDQPDFGVLFADMDVSGAATIPASSMLQARAEAEIAFVLAEDFGEGELDLTRVRSAIGYAVAASVSVDIRVDGWDIALTDTVADNASSGLFVLSEHRFGLDEFEPKKVRRAVACRSDHPVRRSGAVGSPACGQHHPGRDRAAGFGVGHIHLRGQMRRTESARRHRGHRHRVDEGTAGRCRPVGGHEDMLVDIALELSAAPDEQIAAAEPKHQGSRT